MKKAPNGEGSVYYENNTDRYVFSYTDQDGQRRRKRFKTRKEADKAKRETLTSMDRGEYGVCTRCGNAIDFARLKAIPHAELCIRCQQMIEDNPRGNGSKR